MKLYMLIIGIFVFSIVAVVSLGLINAHIANYDMNVDNSTLAILVDKTAPMAEITEDVDESATGGAISSDLAEGVGFGQGIQAVRNTKGAIAVIGNLTETADLYLGLADEQGSNTIKKVFSSLKWIVVTLLVFAIVAYLFRFNQQ